MQCLLKSADASTIKTACLILSVFENKRLSPLAQQLDDTLNGQISRLMKSGDITGKMGQVRWLYPAEGVAAKRLLVVGCGPIKQWDKTAYRDALTHTYQALSEVDPKEAVLGLYSHPVKGIDVDEITRLSAEVWYQKAYQFTDFHTDKPQPYLPKKVIFPVTRKTMKAAQRGLDIAYALNEGMRLTQHWANMPANHCTPSDLANVAQTLANEHEHCRCTVLDKAKMTELGMGALLSVAQGSPEVPPKFIILEYQGQTDNTAPIVLVGKGVTFDTGGNSLKPAASMMGMKYDMCGAATVLGVMKAAATLKLPLSIVGLIPSTENACSGTATKPDDVITSLSGTTIEVRNTDAEGRLILADALTYAARYQPEVVIDIATLTGAAIMAFGHELSAVMGNDKTLINALQKAGDKADDKAWPLPLDDVFAKTLKSPYADLSNISSGHGAGTITAGCFLGHFAKDYRWAHLDVAGTAAQWSGSKRGATGRPVPLLLQYLLDKTSKTH